MNLLICDDSALMRYHINRIVTQGFVDISVIGEASNGIEVVEKYQSLRPDVVTMDITIPEMNGIDALKKIKEFDQAAKVVMVSAMGQKPMIMESIESGATDFIIKPFPVDKLVGLFENLGCQRR